MIDEATVVTAEGLEAFVSALSRVGSDDESDQVRVDQLAVLGPDRQHLRHVVGVGVVDREDRHGGALQVLGWSSVVSRS